MNRIRKNFAFLWLSILLLQSFTVTSYAAKPSEGSIVPLGTANTDIPTAIENYVKEHEETTAGMSVAVYDGNGVIYQNYFGYADKENNVAVANQTVYEWGSISKLFIWISAMQLVEQGKLDLQMDIKTYLPDGFLKNLTSDKPITMLDLMNHQAGFQETYFIQTANAEDMVSLEEALCSHQPKQIYEPGEYTAYSNWGAALAAFIVQRVSGMDYAEYVHQNIFEPLDMEHTSIGAVYEDNLWVKEQRERLVCYDLGGEKIPGKGIYYIYLYPAGSAAGTISDLLTFAQAITPNQNADCPLFEKQETLDLLYTATSYYGTSGVPNNYHGFFASQYGVETLGHGGNTFGCSTMLQFDPNTGIGMVVMTNQAHEKVYNYDMYELIFGKFSDSELADIPRDVPQGFVTSTRTIKEGPLSLLGSMGISGFCEEDLESWWWQDGDHIYGGYFDNKVCTEKTIANLCFCLLFLFAGVYGAVTVIGGGLICYPIQKVHYRRKGFKITQYHMRKWNYTVCGIMAAIFTDFVILFIRMNIGNITGNIGSITGYMVQSAIIGVLAIALIVCLMWGLFSWRKNKKHIIYTKKEKVKYIVTEILALCMLSSIVLFDMYQFWAI